MSRPEPRLRLAPASRADAPAMLELLQPESSRNLSFFTQEVTLQRQEAFLTEMETSPVDQLFVVRHLADDRLIGTAGLHEIDRVNGTARIGLLIFRAEDRGQGYGGEAIRLLLTHGFDQLLAHKIYLNVFAGNHRGQSLYTRLGFVPEGRLRQEYLLEDTRHDLIRMALLREEWHEL